MATNTDPKNRPLGLAEFLFNELRHAIRDTRQKLIDEGWFGRRSASNTQSDGFSFDVPKQTDPVEALYGKHQTFEERLASKEPDKASREQGIGIDI